MIIKYLTELLYDNECVIVADFGAFITQRHSAVIDYTNNRFTPPYKEIIFNNKLVADDGLLVDFISKKENITKEEATEKISKFVNQTMAALEVNSQVELENLGNIVIDFKGDYVFTINERLNLLSDSFGMESFECNAIYRTETYHDLKEKIAVEQKQKNTEYTVALESVEPAKEEVKKRPSVFKSVTYVVVAFMLLFAINWTTDRSNSNLASWNPFLYSSPNEFFLSVMKPASSVMMDRTMPEIAMMDAIPAPLPISTVAPETRLTITCSMPSFISTPSIDAAYFIIGGSFQTEESAEKCRKKIESQGFDGAAILEKNTKGYFRVYYESYVDKQEAITRLEEIRRDYNESAWLLFQK